MSLIVRCMWLLLALSVPWVICFSIHAAVSKPFYFEHQYPDSVAVDETFIWRLNYTSTLRYDSLVIDGDSSLSIQIVSIDHDPQTRQIEARVVVKELTDIDKVKLKLTTLADDGSPMSSAMISLHASGDGRRTYLHHLDAIYARMVAHQHRHSTDRFPAFLLQADVVESEGEVKYSDGQHKQLGYYQRQIQAHIKPHTERRATRDALQLQSAAVEVTVKGAIRWQDGAGGFHRLPAAIVEVYHDNGSSADTLIGTTVTNADGSYSVLTQYDNNNELPDIYVKVLASSSIAVVMPNTATTDPYAVVSSTKNDQVDGSILTVNLDIQNTTAAGQSFSIHHAMVVAGTYTALINGSAPAKISTRFPSTGSFFNGEIHIVAGDKWDWDVIHHEYGHYVMDAYNFENTPGGPHSLNQNLAETLGKGKGIRLAWGEGWPTFFGTAAQYALNTSSLGIANVGDIKYDDAEDAALSYNIETERGYGEDNEMSVTTALWDLFDANNDGESTQINGPTLFRLAKNNGVQYLSQFWEALISGKTNQQKMQLGGVFALNKIAPELTAPAPYSEISAGTVFSWVPNGGGPSNRLDDFTLRFYDINSHQLIASIPVPAGNSYALTEENIAAFPAGTEHMDWVVVGSNQAVPATPSVESYWSASRITGKQASVIFVVDDTSSMTEEINAVVSGLQSYLDLLATNVASSNQTLHLITFKDSVSHRLTTNDIDTMKAAVDGIYVSGGDSCPEASGAALVAAADLIAPGGTIFLATDASNNSPIDLEGLINQLRGQGVTVHTILSGDCGDGARAKTVQGGSNTGTYRDVPEGGSDVIDEAGTASIEDDAGGNQESATPYSLGTLQHAAISNASDRDYFSVELEAGKAYSIVFGHEADAADYPVVNLQLRDVEGNVLSIEESGDSLRYSFTIGRFTSERLATVSVEGDGVYYFRFYGSGSHYLLPYYFSLSEQSGLSSISNNARVLFSIISTETGGAFENITEVNSGDSEQYSNTLFNILRSTTEPSIVSSNIGAIPQGTEVDITLTGKQTNWQPTTSVSFETAEGKMASGIELSTVSVVNATTMVISVSVDADATTQSLTVKTSSPLGTEQQTADGIGLVKIVDAVSRSQLLSVSPSTISQGQESILRIQGTGTAFTADSELDMGEGILVKGISAISNTVMDVTVVVNDNAPPGLRAITADNHILTDGVIVTLARAISTIQSVSPGQLHRRLVVDVTVTGFDTQFDSELSEVLAGDGITVADIRVNSLTELIARLTVDDSAKLGYRNLTVQTGSDTVSILNGLYVDAVPIVIVPDVTGLATADAEAALIATHLTVTESVYETSSTVTAGTVITQLPVAGEPALYASEVGLTISSGLPLVTVENFVGLTVDTAQTAMDAIPLTLGTVSYQSSNSVEEGVIISQSQDEGTQITALGQIDLVVSTGLPMVAVPAVEGLTEAEAQTALESAGLALGVITQQTSSTVSSGNIISQSIASGTSVITDSAIDIVVSSGPPQTVSQVSQSNTSNSGGGGSFSPLLLVLWVLFFIKGYRHGNQQR